MSNTSTTNYYGYDTWQPVFLNGTKYAAIYSKPEKIKKEKLNKYKKEMFNPDDLLLEES